MIQLDFSTYTNKNIEVDEEKKKNIIDRLYQDKMAGFINNIIDDNEIKKIKEVSKRIQENSDVLIVIGIGGSFMGSYAIKNMFLNSFMRPKTEVIYLGTDLSSSYLSEVLDYIKDKEVSLNVISKSGTTMEIQLVYKLVKERLEEKYSHEELKDRIIITTDSEKGKLREEVSIKGYTSFVIPDDIGGRYSLMTAAHLLPISVMGLDISEMLSGYREGLTLIDDSYYYANLRVELFKDKKYIENFSVYEPKLYYYTEWIKQLLGESEGKNGKGIFPISTVNTRDLHSLGQFIQEGNPILFETVIKVLNSEDIEIGNISLNKLNHLVSDAVCTAHFNGNTPSIIISIDELSLKNVGSLSAFFMLAAAFSAYLFEVDPFNQPGVEAYKSEVKKRIDLIL